VGPKDPQETHGSGRARPAGARRILLIRLRALGDVLLSTPTVRAVRRAYPDAYLALMVRRNMAGAVEGNPHLDEVFVCDPWYGEGWSWPRQLVEFLRVVRRLRARKFDTVVDLFGNPRSAWLTWLSGAPVRVGYDVRGRRFAYTLRRERYLQKGTPRREVDVHLDMVRPLGIATEDRRLEMSVGERDRETARRFLRESGVGDGQEVVSLSPGAKWQAKAWPERHYVRLARGLAEAGCRVIVLWGPGEKDLAARIAASAGSGVVMGPPTDLKELAALIESSSALIGTDSGVTHIAEAVGTPSVVLYGPTDPRVWHPENQDRHVALYREDLDCRGCNRKRCETRECMDGMTPDRVVEAWAALRQRAGGRYP
jgi:predicted lipopolysaccharide heptosyltransferase III